MGRNRNDSGGSFNHAQMRASFTDMYRKRIGMYIKLKKNTSPMKWFIKLIQFQFFVNLFLIGNQDVKKNVKVNKETIKKHDTKINSSSLYKASWISKKQGIRIKRNMELTLLKKILILYRTFLL